MTEEHGTVEPDAIPDVIPDVTPDTPAEEAPAVPDHPKEGTHVPAPDHALEARVDSLSESLNNLTEMVAKLMPPEVEEIITPDDPPTRKSWVHRNPFSRH